MTEWVEVKTELRTAVFRLSEIVEAVAVHNSPIGSFIRLRHSSDVMYIPKEDVARISRLLVESTGCQ